MSLETELSFPTVVTGTTRGSLTVRNTGTAVALLADGGSADGLAAVAVQGAYLTSGAVTSGVSGHPVELAPGQERQIPVLFGPWRCAANGHTDTDHDLAHGYHQAVVVLRLAEGRELASAVADVNYQGSP